MRRRGRDIILFLLQNMPNGALKTQLVKLLFLVDLKAKERLGRTLTGFTYRLYLYGPYSPEIEDVLREMELNGDISILGRISFSGNRYVVYFAERDEEIQICDDEKEIIKDVLKEYGDKPLEELLDDVYALEIVKKHSFGEVVLSNGREGAA